MSQETLPTVTAMHSLSVRDLIRLVEFQDRPEACSSQAIDSRLRNDRHNAHTRLVDAAKRLRTDRGKQRQSELTYVMGQHSIPLSEDHVRLLRCLHHTSYVNGIAQTPRAQESTAATLQVEMERTVMTLYPDHFGLATSGETEREVESKSDDGNKKKEEETEEAQQKQKLVRTASTLSMSIYQ